MTSGVRADRSQSARMLAGKRHEESAAADMRLDEPPYRLHCGRIHAPFQFERGRGRDPAPLSIRFTVERLIV